MFRVRQGFGESQPNIVLKDSLPSFFFKNAMLLVPYVLKNVLSYIPKFWITRAEAIKKQTPKFLKEDVR